MAAAAAQVPLVELPRVVVVGELLTDSAATVSVVELDRQVMAATNVAAVAGQAANFFVATNGARSFNDVFALRGLTNTPIFGDPAVSVYLDDLPLGSGFTYPVELPGFARVKLHRGPTQNTVFGRAGSAGVLTFSTPEPDARPQAELRAALGSFGARTVRATASSAGGGPLEAFVNANYSARDGYITNTTLHRDVDFQDSRSGLVRLRAHPSATSEITLLTTYSRSRNGSQPLVPLGGPLFAVSRGSEGFTNLEAWNAALTAAWAVPAGRLSATVSRSDWDLDPYRSVLAFGPSELGNEVQLRQRTWNGELKLTGSAPSTIHWSAGLFYSDGRTDGAFARAFGPFLFEQSSYRIFASNLAGLGEVTWPVGDRLTVTAGLRLEDSRKRIHRSETVPVPRTYENEVSASAWLPKAGLRYSLGEGKTFFATVGAGFKPGGFSAFTGNASLAAFGPERTKTAEAGVTLQRPGNTLAATGRLFFYDITGFQIERSFATGSQADDYLVVNAPRARSWGGEFELTWRPLEALAVIGTLGVTDVTLRTFSDPYTAENYAGNRAPAVPVYDASLRAVLSFKPGFFAETEVNANGRTYYTEGEDLSFSQRAYTLIGARLGYERAGWRLVFYGGNLGNTRYLSAITPGAGHATPGEPRTFGAEVSRKF